MTQTGKKKKGFNRILDILTDKGYLAPRADRLPTLSPNSYKLIGTNPHEFHLWLRNKKQPDIKQANALADLLRVDIRELWEQPKAEAV